MSRVHQTPPSPSFHAPSHAESAPFAPGGGGGSRSGGGEWRSGELSSAAEATRQWASLVAAAWAEARRAAAHTRSPAPAPAPAQEAAAAAARAHTQTDKHTNTAGGEAGGQGATTLPNHDTEGSERGREGEREKEGGGGREREGGSSHAGPGGTGGAGGGGGGGGVTGGGSGGGVTGGRGGSGSVRVRQILRRLERKDVVTAEYLDEWCTHVSVSLWRLERY
jgi:hypothetical protein